MNTKPDRPAAPAAAAKGRSSARAKIDARVIAVWCLVVVAGGAVAAIVWEPWQHLPAAQEQTLQSPNFTPPPILSTPSLGAASLATTGQNPAPYQYDPIKDQHWVPGAGHEHWHAGQPPANAGTTTTTAPAGTTVRLPAPGTVPSSIQNPQPWQYDEAHTHYWDPVHKHWHPGPPPAGKVPATRPPAESKDEPASQDKPASEAESG